MPEARFAFAPFPAQVAFFRRKVNVPSARWDDLLRADHAHGFMVAGLARADVLEDMRRAVADAIERGETLADFRARFEQIVQGRWEGWTGSGSARGRAWRTRIIYQTNLRTSYMAGRWETLRQFPFLRYQHNTLENYRHDHKAWDGKIIARDDPWWDVHYPPNGWGCRCTVTGVSAQRLAQLRGRRGPDAAPERVSKDPPPEWAYHVGEAARSMPAAAQFGQKLMQLPPAWRDIALADAQRRAAQVLLSLPFEVESAFAARTLVKGEDRYPAVAFPMGWLRPATAARLSDGSLIARMPTTALLASDAKSLRHGVDADKRDADLVRDAMATFAEWSTSGQAVVLWDSDKFSPEPNPGIVYALRQADGRYVKLVFRLDFRPKKIRAMRKQGAVANWLRTGGLVTRANLRESRHTLLEGEL